MTLTVITGWSPAGWLEYGHRFLRTFQAHWPLDVRLVIYGEPEVETLQADHIKSGGHDVRFIGLDRIPGCTEFLWRHRDSQAARGRLRMPHHQWKERAVAAGYNWRYDAWKFCRQGFIPWHASQTLETQWLLWLDGDVVTHRTIESASVITGLMPPRATVAYLGREPKHPDIAFQLYRLNIGGHPLAQSPRTMLAEFARLYWSDDVFKLKEWHSAYVWKEAAARTQMRDSLHNLTPGGSGHVWHQSPLAQWGDHLKGDRKSRDRSPESRR